MSSRSSRLYGRARLSVPVGEPGVHYASCGTELAQSSARASLCGAPCLALVGVSALHVRRHASRESRTGLDIPRGNGNRSRLVPPRVAPPCWHCRPLRCARAHIVLALSSLYQRRHLRLPAWEAHATPSWAEPPAAPRDAYRRDPPVARLVCTSDSYTRLVLLYWQFRPELGLKQTSFDVCLGARLHGAALLAPSQAVVPSGRLAAFGIALLIPVLALLGFVQAGREVTRLSQQEDWLDQRLHRCVREPRAACCPGTRQRHHPGRLCRQRRTHTGRPCGAIHLCPAASDGAYYYPDGRQVAVPMGSTVLEASRHGKIPHASVCGGRGRCSTCRIRVVRGLEFLPPGNIGGVSCAHERWGATERPAGLPGTADCATCR